MTVANVGYRPTEPGTGTSGTDSLGNVDVHIERNSGGENALEIIGIIFATIFTLGAFWIFFRQSRLVFDNFSEKDEDALRQMGRDIARSPSAGPALRAHYRALRRQEGESAFTTLRSEVEAALVRANPEMARNDRRELRNAAHLIASGIARELDAEAPVPSSTEGLDRLTRELETTTPAPGAVSRAQGWAFSRFTDIMREVTRFDERALDRGEWNVFAGLFLAGLTWGAAAHDGAEMEAGVVTGDELRLIGERAHNLPESDRRIMASVISEMVRRNQVRIVHADAGAVDALVSQLTGSTPVSAAEATCGRLIADLCTADFVCADLASNATAGPLSAESEAALRTFKTQLMGDLSGVPASIQRLARDHMRRYLERIPSTVTSETLTSLRTLFPNR